MTKDDLVHQVLKLQIFFGPSIFLPAADAAVHGGGADGPGVHEDDRGPHGHLHVGQPQLLNHGPKKLLSLVRIHVIFFVGVDANDCHDPLVHLRKVTKHLQVSQMWRVVRPGEHNGFGVWSPRPVRMLFISRAEGEPEPEQRRRRTTGANGSATGANGSDRFQGREAQGSQCSQTAACGFPMSFQRGRESHLCEEASRHGKCGKPV
mmetsp:Transcript_83475/g.239781  ORF Transcript_83475/g.239781 Transcript_83475/m.239781 type:complete len:206 (-) Transcript_83475:752-1369(-)